MTPFLLVALEFSVQSKGRFKKKPAVTQKLRKKKLKRSQKSVKGDREGNGNLETFPTQSLFIENLKVFSRLFVVVHSSYGEIDFDNMKALFYAVSLTFQL